MGTSSNSDFAIARAIYKTLLSIIDVVREAESMDFPVQYDITELNRIYVLLVHELGKLYNQNPELSDTNPQPFWKVFDILKTQTWDILAFLNEPEQDKGQAHILRLDRLCIIADQETPELSTEQTQLVKDSKKAVDNYRHKLEDAKAEEHERIDGLWKIPDYRLTYEHGKIVVNEVWLLKRTHIDSTIDRLLEQAIKSPSARFTPELGRTSRNVSTVLSSAGFVPVLRQLFFPEISSKSVLFRPVVSKEQAKTEKIDTEVLDLLLNELGAHVIYTEV